MTFLQFNQNLKILDSSNDRWIESRQNLNAFIHSDDLKQFSAELKQALNNKQTVIKHQPFRLCANSDKDTEQWIQAETWLSNQNSADTIDLLPSDDEESTQFQSCFINITDFFHDQDQQRALELQNKQLIQANQEIEHFAYAASHDLQEPLRSLIIYSQLLKESASNTEQGPMFQEETDYILNAATRMRSIVNDILEFSNSGRIIELKSIDPEKCIAEAQSNLETVIEESQAQIIINNAAPFPKQITADERLICILFQNLLSNAIKYRQKDQAPKITISASESSDRPGEILFSIKDNGIGIEKDYQTQVFDAFKRLHTRQEYEGTGIGLATCKRIIDKHHGEIWVESEGKGHGTVFKFSLPKQSSA